jgi:adenylate cyclase
MGKSRLVVEFGHQLATRGLTVRTGRCLSYGSVTPYLPVRELLRHHCGLTETAPPAQRTATLARHLQDWGLAVEEALPVLLDLLGLPDETNALTTLSPEARKARLLRTLTQLWLQSSRQGPLVLIVEDLHWSDPSTDEWLLALVERLMGTPLLVIGTYRPGSRPGWLDKSYVTQIALPALSSQDSLQVVQAVLPPTAHTAALVPHLLAKAEGNPFFLEELARTVLEQDTTAAVPTIPETVQAVLLARLDRLPPPAKRLLQAAPELLAHHYTEARRAGDPLLAASGGAGQRPVGACRSHPALHQRDRAA